AKKRWVHRQLDCDIPAGNLGQCSLQLLLLGGSQLMRRRHLGSDFAARTRRDLAKGTNDARNGEQTAILRNDAQETADQTADLGLVGNCRHSLELVFCRKHGTGDQALEIIALFDESLKTRKVLLDLRHLSGFYGEV